MSTLNVRFVTADRTVWEGEASQVVAPGIDGSFGILPHMQPVLSILAKGLVKITGADGAVTEREVGGGFISVDHDIVTIGVDYADSVS